jgi:hypothetical protein
LVAADVLTIRALYASGGYLQRDLAERFGVTPAAVGHICVGRRWRHLPLRPDLDLPTRRPFDVEAVS